VTELGDVRARITNLEQARKAAPVVRRLDMAAAEFRITPAQRAMYGGHALQLSEDGVDWLLSEIESRPPITALAKTVDESARLDQAAKAHIASPYPRTPAMAAGVSDHVWKIEEIVALLEA
jgi:phage I-like protein